MSEAQTLPTLAEPAQVEAWKCPDCQELYHEKDEAVECCLTFDMVQAYECPLCGNLFTGTWGQHEEQVRDEAKYCCQNEPEPIALPESPNDDDGA